MPDLTVSGDIDAFMGSANQADMRANIGASSLGDGLLTSANRRAASVLMGVIFGGATETRSINFTVDSTKPGVVYEVTAGAAGVTATLPALVAGDDGFVAVICKVDTSAGVVAITGPGITDRMVIRDECIVYRWDGVVWGRVLVYNPAEGYRSVFSTKSDGDVVISGSVVLARDMHYRVLTIAAGASLDPAGYIIYAETLDISAAPVSGIRRISPAANAPTGTNSSTGGAVGAAVVGRTLPGANNPTAGGNGATGNGSQATAVAAYSAFPGVGGAGGAGGNGGTGNGAASRGAQPATASYRWRGMSPYGIGNQNSGGAATLYCSGASGPGGSGGGGDGTNSGGGGGAGGRGGAIIVIYALKIITSVSTAAACIACTGGLPSNGGSPTVGNCGGGGGGGGGSGGTVVVIYYERSGPQVAAAISVAASNGGNGGNGNGTGLAGNGGASGASGHTAVCNLSTGIWVDDQPAGQTNQVSNTGQTGGVAPVANGAI